MNIIETQSRSTFQDRVHAVLAESYHHQHPFHQRMHEGGLSREELQDWVANRYYYQSQMPVKDAVILSRLPTRAARRSWIGRIVDQDGAAGYAGGLEEWLRLAEEVGLARVDVESGSRLVPGAHFAVEAYLRFCSVRPWQEAVAASLTQLYVPDLMRTRSEALARHYGLTAGALAYFNRHSDVSVQESQEALELLSSGLHSREEEERALEAVRFKCSVLNALLDAVDAIR
jgi:pyrroloquinoline-quinone synthase